MKQLFFRSLFWPILILGAVACEDSGNKGGNDDPQNPQESLFEITVQNVKAVMAEVSVEPRDRTMTYYADVLNDADFQLAMERGFDDYLQWYIGVLMTDYNLSYDGVIEMITSVGHENFTLMSLEPETRYHALAVGIDSEGYVTTSVESVAFTTEPAEVSENTFEVTITENSHFGATVSVDTSNEDNFIFSVEPAILLEGKSDEQIAEEIISGGLAWGGIVEMIHQGDYTEEVMDCKPGWDYEAICFGYSNGLATTAIKRVPFSTLPAGDPTACTFEMTAEFEPFQTQISIMPSDDTVVYIADLIEEEYLKILVEEFGSQERALAENLEAMIDFYDEELGGRGAAVNLITTCGRVDFPYTHKPEQEYHIWAAMVDQEGNLLAPVVLGEKFRTPEEQIADARLTLKGWTCFDGDELYKLDKEAFANAKGYAVLYTEVEPSEGAAEWIYYAAYGDLTGYSRRTLINNLMIAPTEKNLTEQMIVCYWGVNTIWGMAMDAEGHYGEVFTEVVELSKENATPVPASFAASRRPAARFEVEPAKPGAGFLRKR